MQSGKSWFNLTLFRKNITRFWPIWGLYLVIWLFGFPINILLDGRDAAYKADNMVLVNVGQMGLFLAFTFSIAAAMAVWSYLYNNRSAGMIHTLPIRREGLFLTNYLSGMAFFVGPNVLIFLLTLLAEGTMGVVNVSAIATWLFGVTLIELFFFSFATFCAMFTGHILCLPIFYGILNVLVCGIVFLVEATLGAFVFGYTGVEGLETAAEWFTPVWKLSTSLWVKGSGSGTWLVGLGYILIYAFCGVVLTALALVVYRRREMERAGDVVTVSWVRPIFQYGVAFCCALAFGTFLYTIFHYSLPPGAWTLLVFMLLCGAAGCFIARMLLEKTFRVLHAWKGCVCFLAALVLLTCVMEFDLTGFERRVPDTDQVASVMITGLWSAPYDAGHGTNIDTDDPEVIQAVNELHRAVIRNKKEIERDDWYLTDISGFSVLYTLEDGRTMGRNYGQYIPVNDELLADPESPAAKIEALINMPQVIWDSYGLEGTSAEQVVALRLSYQVTENYEGSYNRDYRYESIELPREGWEMLYEAVIADFAEGNLGRRYLQHSSQERLENCYVNDLVFVFYVEEEADDLNRNEVVQTTRNITIGLQTTAVHTLDALEKLGVLSDEVQLITHAQVEQLEENSGGWEEAGSGTVEVPAPATMPADEPADD